MKIQLINIINRKLFKYTNRTYITIVKKIIGSHSFKEENIEIEYWDDTVESKYINEIFAIDGNGKIVFFHKENLIKFIYNSGQCKINTLLNINIKNQKTYEIIKVLESLQKKFFASNCLKDLKSITHDDIIKKHKTLFGSYISSTLISYILNNTKYRDSNNKILYLSYLTPKKHFIQYTRIKCILNIHPLASDKELHFLLKKRFNIAVSPVQISKIRKRYFIPKKSDRSKELPYKRFIKYFSPKKEFTRDNISKYKNINAVYELIDKSKIDYNFTKCSTVYIGSTKDLYSRLNDYINENGHTGKLKQFLKDKENIYFRFIETQNYREIEKVLLNEFQDFCGNMPILNSNRLYL